MKKRVTYERRGKADISEARFFQFLPCAVAESLDITQRRAIVRTILKLQADNPRILDEIYMEQPYPGRAPGEWSMLDRMRRRLNWRLRGFWLALLRQKSERRPRTRLSDYLFVLLIALLVSAFLWYGFLGLYWIKSDFLGLNVFPGYSLSSRN
ncbi:MAG: hypothetical protein K0U93_04605 [Gammaproteobacteria bacterium]|nr:hypothetical protein [Gammaproteobacteria bacterium]